MSFLAIATIARFLPRVFEILSKVFFKDSSCLIARQEASTSNHLMRAEPCLEILPLRVFSPDEYSLGVKPV
jgi:hypothetical protein